VKKLKGIDKSILVGILLTFAFLILWLVTLPKITDNSNYSNLNESEIKRIYLNDTEKFNTALLLGDLAKCNSIENKTMKKECSKILPDKVVVISNPNSAANANPDDADNYNNAILTKNSSLCSKIQDENMKNDCINAVSQTASGPSEAPVVDPADADNFNSMILEKDKTYCEYILDTALKAQCQNYNLQV
jgi:hypothetical protein